jgi:hypothetical protein
MDGLVERRSMLRGRFVPHYKNEKPAAMGNVTMVRQPGVSDNNCQTVATAHGSLCWTCRACG